MFLNNTIYKTDYHTHTYYSDGRGWPEDYIGRAKEIGLKEIGFSDHLTLTEEQQDWSIKPSKLNEYSERILRIKERVSGIKVRLGLEVDYFPGKEDEISRAISALPLDYVIGSVHYLGEESVDLGREYYKDKNINEIFESYFRMVSRAAATGLFDFMAHPDLVRIYNYNPSGNPEPMYRELAADLKKSDVAFEINTNGMNKPLQDFYPDRNYLRVFREEGVPVCVNSDAHAPIKLGQHFDEAYDLLKDAGFTQTAVFSKRQRSMKSLNDR